jgi:5-methylcytosine-specific restriction endonuclease McrA
MQVVPLPIVAECCAYCGREFNEQFYGTRKTKDHIVPRSVAPSGTRDGVIYACGSCNSIKANMLPDAMRIMADAHRNQADHLDRIAAKVDELIKARGLLT